LSNPAGISFTSTLPSGGSVIRPSAFNL
jgi:hypothetical protein